MPKINLKVNSDRAFGKYLPSVYIDRIIVSNPILDSGVTDASLVTFQVKLAINFTFDGKDKDVDYVKDWIDDHIDDLYLYAWISPHATLNNALENKNLNLKNLFKSYEEVDITTFTADKPVYKLVVPEMIESFVNKHIDYFGEGYGRSGGHEIMDAILEDAGGSLTDGLKTLYYFSDHIDLRGSVNQRGSIMNTLFYGHGTGGTGEVNMTGPWDFDGEDLPETVTWSKGSFEPADSELFADAGSIYDTFRGSEAERQTLITKYYTDPYYNYSWFSSNELMNINGATWLDSGASASGGTVSDGVYETSGVPDGESFMKANLAKFLPFYAYDPDSDNHVYEKIKLTDLLGDGDTGQLIKREVYDDKGDEIIQITNITLDFIYDSSSSVNDFLLMVPKLFFISTIGLDVDDVTDAPIGLFNNYFGGITFETILTNGTTDDSFSEIFVEAETGAPYDGIPLQALSGKYYAEEPISRSQIINSLGSIAKKYKKENTKDGALLQNIKNLQYILTTYKDSTNLFSEFKKYQKTYPIKSQSTASGRFYNEIVNEMVQFSKKISLQREVTKKIILNSIVIDLRDTQFITETPTFPDPSTAFSKGFFSAADSGGSGTGTLLEETMSDSDAAAAAFATGVGIPIVLEEYSDDYIPRAWMTYSRKSRMTTLLDTGPWASMTGFMGSDYMDILADYLDRDTSASFYDDPGSAASAETLSMAEILAEWEYHTSNRSEMFSDRTGHEIPVDVNFVCENKGFFFFDWEKALHTQSRLAKVLVISKLHRFFGLAVPYRFFDVQSVTLVRVEPKIQTRGAGPELEEAYGTMSSIPYFTNVMHMDMDYGDESGAPYSDFSKHFMAASNMSDDGLIDGDGKTQWYFGDYGVPRIQTVGSDGESDDWASAYLKFINFDVVASNKDYRLEGYGRFSPYEDIALEKGYKIRDGYRLMCFKFRDFMDDDVAYYNTLYEGDSSRFDALEAINPRGEAYTPYNIRIVVKDRTLEFFSEHFVPLLFDTYDELKEYADFAADICSYNNITGVFNKFFIDAAIEKYATSDVKPWIKAALIINTCRQLFFQEFTAGTDTTTESNIIYETVNMVNKFSPEKGSLESLQQFVSEYKRFLMYFDSSVGEMDDVEVSSPPEPLIRNRIGALCPDLPEDWTYGSVVGSSHLSNVIEFANSFSIIKPIYGNFYVDSMMDSDRSASDFSGDMYDGGMPHLVYVLTAAMGVHWSREINLNFIADLMSINRVESELWHPTGPIAQQMLWCFDGDNKYIRRGRVAGGGVMGMMEYGTGDPEYAGPFYKKWEEGDPFFLSTGYIVQFHELFKTDSRRLDRSGAAVYWEMAKGAAVVELMMSLAYFMDSPTYRGFAYKAIAALPFYITDEAVVTPVGVGAAMSDEDEYLYASAATKADLLSEYGRNYINSMVSPPSITGFTEDVFEATEYFGYDDSSASIFPFLDPASAPTARTNQNGLNAQSLLYVIRNHIFPLTGTRAFGTLNGTIDGAMEEMFGDKNTAGRMTGDGDPVYTAADHEDWLGSLGLGDGKHGYDTRDDSMVCVADLLVPQSTLHSDADETTLDLSGFADTGHDGSGRNMEDYSESRKYYQFRQTLSHLHDALLDICLGITGDFSKYEDTSDASPRGERGHFTRYRYMMASLVRSYLDRDDPIGPDFCGLRDDATGDFVNSLADSNGWYDLYDLEISNNQVTNVYAKSSWYKGD